MNLSVPRIYGTPSGHSKAQLKTRGDFENALRENDQKSLSGLALNDQGELGGLMGYATLFPGAEVQRFSGFASYIEAGTKKVWATARAIDLVANVVISTETRITWRDQEKNRNEVKTSPKPELIKLLQNPNPFDTISELMYLWVAHMKLTGNVFWFKDEMNGYNQPKAIYALNPAFVRIVPDKDARVKEYRYRVNGSDIRILPEEMIHFRRPNAADPLYGLGEIESGQSLYEEFINSALYNTRFYKNGARPSAVLVKEDGWQKTQDEWEKYQAAFNEKYGGVGNAGKTAWMSGKWSLLNLGITAQAMQEIEKRSTNVQEIFLNHGVPLSIAGIMKAANFATAGQDDRNFRRYTCLPLLNLFADTMNSPRGFVSAFNPDLKLDFSLSGLVDVEQVMKDNGPLFDRGGITPNDLRELVGLPRKKDPLLDQHFMLAGYVPIELAGATQPSEADIQGTSKPKPAQKPDQNTADGGGDGKNGKKFDQEGDDARSVKSRRVAVRKTDDGGYELQEITRN